MSCWPGPATAAASSTGSSHTCTSGSTQAAPTPPASPRRSPPWATGQRQDRAPLPAPVPGHAHRAAGQARTANRPHLKDILSRLHAAGVREVFVIAGDVPHAAGEFTGALPLLQAMAELGNKPERIGVTGYPESHPFIDDDVTIQAMWDKRRYATHIVSQICFDVKTLGGWIRRVRRRGMHLPIYVGMPGPIDPLRLMQIATKIGIGESARFLTGHGGWLRRLLLPGGYSPDRFLAGLLPYALEPGSALAGLHVYTFNRLAECERWRNDAITRLRDAT